jgi:hypothetical protein
VNFGEHGKSSGRHPGSLGFRWGLTMTLTKGWPHMCVNLINGVIRVGW